MNFGAEVKAATSPKKTSTSLRRRRDSSLTSNHLDRLKKRDIAFTKQTVTVVKKVGEFGTSHLYSAKDDGARRRDGNTLLIKATAAATIEQARRATAEVRLLRKLVGATGIPTIIDCGFSTIEERVYDYELEGDRLEARRLYCLLLEPCPDYFLNDFIKRRRRKYTSRGTRNLFSRTRKDAIWEGYLSIDTILDIFGQMVSAIFAIHNFEDETDSKETEKGQAERMKTRSQGLVHLDIQPSRFFLRKLIDSDAKDEKYDVKLCSFGCTIRRGMSVNTDAEREEAAKLIESSSSPMYRSPEMTDLSLGGELGASSDIWGLGCCFYELLFLTECFKGFSKQDILRGVFLLPVKHPYSLDVIELLARMLTVNAIHRATIEEVQNCVTSLKNGEPLPARQSSLDLLTTRDEPNEAFGESSRRSSQLEGEPSEESRIQLLGNHLLSPTHRDGEIDDSVNRLERFHASSSSYAGECSDDTDFSEWLEFKPGSSDGLNLEKRVAHLPLSTRIMQRGSMRRRRRANDPLSLGAASASFVKRDQKKQNLFADWTLGLINQLSSRSLNPIEASVSDSASGEKDDGITPLASPSLRLINPYGLALKTKDSPGVNRSYGPGRFLKSAPSLRVADLMKSKRHRSTSASSSDFGSSSNNDFHGSDFHSSTEGPQTSNEWFSSTELASSSEMVSLTEQTMSTSDMSTSQARTNTPMTESTKVTSVEEFGTPARALKSSPDSLLCMSAPLSAPVRTGTSHRLSMFERGVSPNVPPAPLYSSTAKSGMISPHQFVHRSETNALISESSIPGPLHASDSHLVMKKKKEKDKSKKKKKDKKTKKSSKHIDSSPAIIAEDGTSKLDPASFGSAAFLEQIETISRSLEIKRLHDAERIGNVEERINMSSSAIVVKLENDILSFGDSKLDNWGSLASIGFGAPAEDANPKKSKKKKKSGKAKPDRSSKIDRRDPVETKQALSLSLDHQTWDLEAAEEWVATKSKEASAKSSASEQTKERREKFQIPTLQHTQSFASYGSKGPEDWVSDAGRWVKNVSSKEIPKLRKELNEQAETHVASEWFPSPSDKATPNLSSRECLIDRAGFPAVSRVGMSRSLAELKDTEQTSEGYSNVSNKSRALDTLFTTPQPQRGKLEVPRSAVSMTEISRTKSKSGSNTSYQTLDSLVSHRFSVDSGAKIGRSKSGSTNRSSKTSLSVKEVSIDSNMPPGDVVGSAEVSLPLPRGNKMSIEEELHMALTAEGRLLKRTKKKLDEESPHVVNPDPQSLENEHEIHKMSESSQFIPGDEIHDEARHKSATSITIPSVIELVPGDDGSDDLGNDANMSPERAFALRALAAWSQQSGRVESSETSKAPKVSKFENINEASNQLSLEEELTSSFPFLVRESEEGNVKVRKKKHGKERKSDRRTSKKSRAVQEPNLEKIPSSSSLNKALSTAAGG